MKMKMNKEAGRTAHAGYPYVRFDSETESATTPRFGILSFGRVLRLTCRLVIFAVINIVCSVFADELSPEAYANFARQVAIQECEKEALSVETRKLQGELLDFSQARGSEQKMLSSSSKGGTDVRKKECQIACAVSDRLIELIVAAGGEVVCKSEPDNVIIAMMSPSSLDVIAKDEDVWNVYPVDKAMTNGNVSEGVVAHKVNTARSGYGVTGRNIKVGVISNSADTYGEDVGGNVGIYSGLVKKLQGSGDLPQEVTIVGDTYGTGEGSGMMEIVYDVAPDATLYFKNGQNTEVGFANDIASLMNAGCKVIVDDLTLGREAAFEAGPIGRKIKEFVDNGGVYFSSAANSGALDRASSCTWEGDYSEGASASSLGGTFHNFGNGNANRITKAGEGRIKLWWSDPWGSSSNDYDLYVVDGNGNILQQSTNSQNGKGCYPFEIIGLRSSDVAKIQAGLYVVVVKKTGAQARFLRIEITRGGLGVATCGSTYGHNAGEDVISCAAASASGFSRAFKSSDPLESYSSDGPRHIFYTNTGSEVTPGNLLSTGGTILQKPDFTAADNTLSAWTSIAFGERTFGGTSAAAPHAAAIAALMLEANPSLTQSDIIAIFKKATFSGVNATWNRNYGYGILDANTAVKLAKESVSTKINITPTTQTFMHSAGDGTISVTASSSWSVTVSDSWITLKTKSGSGNGMILYSVENNEGTSERSGTITVISGSDEAIHIIRQSAASARLSINPNTADYSDVAGNGQFSVSANYSWSATTSDSWISLNTSSGIGNGTVLYSIEPNGGSRRTGTITVTSGSLTATHTVTQAAQPSLSIVPESKTFSAAAGNGTITVTSDSMWTVSKSATWIILDGATGGTGNGIVSYKVLENTGSQRQGWIYVSCGSVKRTLLVTQNRADSVTFSAESANVSEDGGTGSFTVTILGNNRVMTATSSTVPWASWTWATEDISEGTRYTFTYNVDPNPTIQKRETVIPIDFNGTVYRFTITQKPHVNNYLVTYRPGANGSGSEAYDVKQKNVSLTLREEIFTRNGYTQGGWATVDGGGKVYNLGASYTENEAITLYPYWEKEPSGSTTYTLRFSPGPYGSGSEQTAKKYKGVAFSLPGAMYTRDGFEQTGWSVFSSGTSKTYELGGTYGNDRATTFYPYWTEKQGEAYSYDIGFYSLSAYEQPMCLSTTNIAYWSYAPQYVFNRGEGLILNYCVRNKSDADATLVDRIMSLWDVNLNMVESEIESYADTIPAGRGMLFPNRNLKSWMMSISPGNYALKVNLDPYGKLNDPDESDNVWTTWFAVKADGITLNEALDCSSLYFTDNGTTAFPQTSESVVGGSCVQLGPQPTNSSNSILWVYVTEPGTLTFKWKATSQDYKAYLGCYVGGEMITWKWATEESEWEEASVEITTAPQWVCWGLGTYEPDVSCLTAGWVDCVTWSGDAKKPAFTVDAMGTLTAVELNGATDIEIPSMVNGVAVRAIGSRVFEKTAVTSVSIPDTITNIANHAFLDCASLAGISIPGSVKSIGETAFCRCHKLRSVVLEDGLEKIGKTAFYNCLGLTYVKLPSSVIDIGATPFGHSPSLKTIDVAQGNPKFCTMDYALVDKEAMGLLQYPMGRSQTSYEVPEGIIGIAYFAFDWATNLTSVTLPKSLVGMGNGAFGYCASLETVRFKGNAPNVGGEQVFLDVPSSCKALVSPQSSGWGVAIPGTWHGIGIEYSAALQTYTVMYNSGAYGTGSQTLEVKSYGTPLPLKGAIYTRKGYLQIGWATSDGGAKAYELGASYMANAAVTLYPYWTANTYAITYELDGGTAGAAHPLSATYGTPFRVSAPTRDGYVFTGWMVSSGLDITTARYGESSTAQSMDIDNASMQCFNGSDVDVWFINLTPQPDGKIVLTATWEPVADDSRDVGFYAPASQGWSFPVCLSSTNIEYLAYAPETEFVQGMGVYLSFCAVNWSTVGPAMLQSTLLTITDESGAIFDQGEPIQRATIGAFGYWEIRNISMRRYLSGITPGRYKLTLELDPNRLLNDPDRSNNTTSIWFTVTAPSDPIPELPSDATAADVRVALAGSADGRLAEYLTDVSAYSAYREWAQTVRGANGTTAAGKQMVKNSNKAWFSFAIDSTKLVEGEIVKDDIKVEKFNMSSSGGQFDFTVGITGVVVGDAAKTEYLKTVFGIEGASQLDNAAFSSDNLVLEEAKPEDGKVKLTAKLPPPRTGESSDSDAFFIRAKVQVE